MQSSSSPQQDDIAGSSPRPEDSIPVVKGALAGIGAGALALAVGELIASFATPTPGPVAAVANRVIDGSPQWLTELGKSLFGTDQKTALIIGTIILSLVFASALGVASRRRPAIGMAGIALFGLVGLASIAADVQGGTGSAIVIAVFAVAAGVIGLLVLLTVARGVRPPEAGAKQGTIVATSGPQVERRNFIGWLGGAGFVAALSAFGAQTLRARGSASAARANVIITGTEGADALTDLVASANASEVAQVPGITPIVVPNSDFYRIDTALIVPQVDPADWKLTVRGMVEEERTYTFDELVERARMTAPVTLSCVSNEVGGGLVGNAIWQGVPLTDLLDDVKPLPGATQIRSVSVDGWDCGFPTDLAYDGRTAMVAIAMNDEALPIEHGFPARMVVSGLYGYVSATKWLQEIELTTLEGFSGYWIPRGWAKDGPVKTQSRIDTPRFGSTLTPGQEISIAGVAWAPNLGIERVEVQIDEEPWQDAELGESLGVNAWSQWRLRWTPTNGQHRIRVRATDGSGATQIEERTPVAPDGASGWHTIPVQA